MSQAHEDQPRAELVSPPQLTAAVVICAYTMDRWDDIVRAVDSAARQTRVPAQVVLVIDHNETLLERSKAEFTGVCVLASTHSKGLSGARNTAVDFASAQVLLMLDDDAVAEPEWVEQMLAPLERDTQVAIVGGHTVAAWDTGRPSWFPPEFDWVVGATYRGIPAEFHEVRNPFGGNAAFRREVFDSVGGFREGVGRVGDDATGGEETELTIRFRQAHPTAKVVYTPTAVIHHRVRAERAQWSYLVKRCLAEGRSKGHVAAHVGGTDATSRERDYASRILVRASADAVIEAVRTRSVEPVGRSAAIVVGLASAAVGYGSVLIMSRTRRGA